MSTALWSAVVLGGVALATPVSAAPVAVGLDGIFEGKLDNTGAIKEFLGIRYAQPVTGNQRWKAPQPVKPSFVPQHVTQFGNHCPQAASPFGNVSNTEDCLFLNVYAPQGFDVALPVMVWIHGGALVVGESDDYNASKLVERGVIVVTINYRLGALGFLAHPALTGESPDHSSGNYGIEDQQEALRWVRRNIIGFGGDPGRVTIFGESAGGLSTFTNLVSPRATGLFHRAIVESGAYMQTQPTLAQAETAGSAFAAASGCTQSAPADVLACLRALPVSTILANQALTFPAGSLGPAPNIDGKVLTQSIGPALGSGQFNRVPLINGSNHSEWNLFVALDFDLVGSPVTQAGYIPAIQATLGVPAAAATGIAALYPPAAFPTPDQGIGSLGTDAIFACPAHFADELTSPYVPTFAYEFNDANAPQNFLPSPPVSFATGASHASEIQYLFPEANPSGVGFNLPQTPLNAAQQQLSSQMVSYWTEFAKHGDPNSLRPGPQWQRFTRANQVMQSLVPATPTSETNFAMTHQCAFWDAASGRTLPPAPNQSASNN